MSEQGSGCASFHSTAERMGIPDGTVLARSRGSTRQVLVGGAGLDARHHRRARAGALPARVRDRAGQLPQPGLPDRGRQRRVPGQLRRRGRHPVVPGEDGNDITDLFAGSNLEELRALEERLREIPEVYAVLAPLTALEYSEAIVTEGVGTNALLSAAQTRSRPRGRGRSPGRHLHDPGPPRRRRGPGADQPRVGRLPAVRQRRLRGRRRRRAAAPADDDRDRARLAPAVVPQPGHRGRRCTHRGQRRSRHAVGGHRGDPRCGRTRPASRASM